MPVMVCGYSRMIAELMIPSRASPERMAGHWRLISGWSRCRGLAWDNEGRRWASGGAARRS
jgi:hypothetical protein